VCRRPKEGFASEKRKNDGHKEGRKTQCGSSFEQKCRKRSKLTSIGGRRRWGLKGPPSKKRPHPGKESKTGQCAKTLRKTLGELMPRGHAHEFKRRRLGILDGHTAGQLRNRGSSGKKYMKERGVAFVAGKSPRGNPKPSSSNRSQDRHWANHKRAVGAENRQFYSPDERDISSWKPTSTLEGVTGKGRHQRLSHRAAHCTTHPHR